MRTRHLLHRRERPVIRDLFEEDIAVTGFAGCGGADLGIVAATGRKTDIAINHDPTAIAVFSDNWPETECYRADIFSVDPVKACRGRRVRHLHVSPDCRHFSRAKGDAPVQESVRSLADVVPNWARAVRPDVITLENVPEFQFWGPLGADGKPIKERQGESFKAWCRSLEVLGYVIEHRVLSAHHYGAHTSRKRLYLVARCDGLPIVWPKPTHGPGLKKYRTAAECIDWSIACPSVFIGPENDEHLERESFTTMNVVLAWGAFTPGARQRQAFKDRVAHVIKLVSPGNRVWTIGQTNGDGSPKHPLYLPAKRPLLPWRGYA